MHRLFLGLVHVLNAASPPVRHLAVSVDKGGELSLEIYEGDTADTAIRRFCDAHTVRHCDTAVAAQLGALLRAQLAPRPSRAPRLFHIHRHDPSNVGDLASSPLRYFNLPLPPLRPCGASTATARAG